LSLAVVVAPTVGVVPTTAVSVLVIVNLSPETAVIVSVPLVVLVGTTAAVTPPPNTEVISAFRSAAVVAVAV
jgi:hypothetical protein